MNRKALGDGVLVESSSDALEASSTFTGGTMARHSITVIALVTLSMASTVHAAPYGASVRVNSYVSGGQGPVETVVNKHGESVTVWADGRGAFLKRYDGAGRTLAPNDLPLEASVRDVGIDEVGNVATLAYASGANSNALVTIRDRTGQVIVPQFRVNDVANALVGNGGNAALVMNDSGTLVVAWTQISSGTTTVFAKLYRRDGSLIAGPVVLAQAASYVLDLAMDARGNSIATWWQSRPDGHVDVWARRISAAGVALDSAFIVNTNPSASAYNAHVAMNRAGTCVVAWASSSGGQQGASAQRFAASGARVGTEFQAAPNYVSRPNVAIADDGSFMVAWDTSTFVMARTFDPNGALLEHFMVGDVAGNGLFPEVGMDASGNSVVVWRQDINVGDNTYDVYMRRYLPGGLAVPALANGQVVSGLYGARGGWRFYKVTVPSGPTSLDVSIFGGAGDADLYVRWGALPNLQDWDGAPYLNGNNETARMLNYPAGDWYIGVNGFADYSGLSLRPLSY